MSPGPPTVVFWDRGWRVGDRGRGGGLGGEGGGVKEGVDVWVA